jgi:hypothetical protein
VGAVGSMYGDVPGVGVAAEPGTVGPVEVAVYGRQDQPVVSDVHPGVLSDEVPSRRFVLDRSRAPDVRSDLDYPAFGSYCGDDRPERLGCPGPFEECPRLVIVQVIVVQLAEHGRAGSWG